MRRIKLILSDIDDTIMPKGAPCVSERTRAAFHAALDAGLAIGPASGRGFAQLAPFFADDAACFSTAITTNGLEVYHAGERIACRRSRTKRLSRRLRRCARSPVPVSSISMAHIRCSLREIALI